MVFSSVDAAGQTKEIAAYYPEWGAAFGKYYVKDLETRGAADKLTVLIYAFSEPAPDSLGVIIPGFRDPFQAYQRAYSGEMSLDGVADDSTQPLRGQFNQLRKLKSRHPNLKILISIGGWTGCKYYSDAVLTPESREKFVDTIIDFYIRGNLPIANGAGGIGVASNIFDGIDIDWEYPVGGGNYGIHNNPNDNNNLTAFYSMLRKRLDAINPKLLITAAVPASQRNASHYNIKEDQLYLNWYNLMTYDYAGEWDSMTDHHTNLLASPSDPSKTPQSFDTSVRFFIDSLDVESAKIVPGAAFYGHAWKNVDSTNDGLYQHGQGIGLSDAEGYLQQYQYLSTLASKGFSFHWDTLAMAPFFYNMKEAIFETLEDPKSVALKSRYVESFHLGGLMCWEISGDDSAGTMLNAMCSGEMPDLRLQGERKVTDYPSIELYLTTKKDQLLAGSNIIMNARVPGRTSIVVKVEFFVDGKSIGYDTEAPFDWVWFNAARGAHEIKAVATDGFGNQKASNTVNVMIKGTQDLN